MGKLTQASKDALKNLTVESVGDDSLTLTDGTFISLDEDTIEELNSDNPDEEESSEVS